MRKYLIFLGFLTLFTFIHFQGKIFNFLGEKIFLDLHANKLAIATLNANRKKDFYSYFLLGRLYFVENNLAKSITMYNKAIEKNPNFKENFYGRGLAYGFYSPLYLEEAQKDFEKYIELDNVEFEKTGRHAYGAWAGYNDLAWVHFLKGDFKNAEMVARKGLEISGLNPWLSNMLGAALLEQGNCDLASKHLLDAENFIKSIETEKFGEAYSGDNDIRWESGKQNMIKSIKDNLLLCNTFPQNTTDKNN